MTEETPKLSPSLRFMKFLVMAMGITLIFGFIFLLSLIYRTVGGQKQESCAATEIVIPNQQRVVSLSQGKKQDELWLLLENDAGTQSMLLVNRCDGEVQQHLKLLKDSLN